MWPEGETRTPRKRLYVEWAKELMRHCINISDTADENGDK